MNRIPFPSTLEFFRNTELGIAAAVVVITITVLLYLSPPSIVKDDIEGVHVRYIPLILISVGVGSLVYLYPAFVSKNSGLSS